MKTHFFLKALVEGDPDGCGKKVHVDFDMDFGFSRAEAFDQCEDLATHFSDFLHSLGYEGSFKFVDPRPLILSGGNPSMAYNPDKEGTDGK